MKTQVRLTLQFQNDALRRISEFMRACDFGNLNCLHEETITFVTTSEVNAEYVDNMKKSIIGKKELDMTIVGVKDVSILL